MTIDLSDLSHMYDSIKADINNVCLSNNHSCGSFYDHTVYRINVVNAIRSLCAGKSGVDAICSDNLRHATDRFIDYIVSLFNSILSHGCVSISFLSSTIIHIPKNWTLKTQRTTELLHSVVCLANFLIKLLLKSKLNGMSELQFGYKTKSSTVMCSTALTETIEYYVSRKTPVYVLLIDASKAFDRVSHIKLFKTLQAHGVCPLIIRVLYNMYTNSDMQVRWKSELSNVFLLMNGVKQGGCLSPMLFTLYLDGLIQKLKHSGIGCHIGRTYCGVFGYADDLAIVSPTLFGLRQMIEILLFQSLVFHIIGIMMYKHANYLLPPVMNTQ